MKHASRLVLCVAVLLLSPLDLAAQSGAQGGQPSWVAELPPGEFSLQFQVQAGLASKLADRLKREDPLGVEFVQALVSARREEEAIGAARRIFDKYPERIARILTSISTSMPSARGEVPGRDERLQTMLDHAKTRMAVLGRAERAEAAYALMKAESSLLRGSASIRSAYPGRLKSLGDEYAGTPTALQIQVDLIERAFYDSRGESSRRNDDLLAFARAHVGTEVGARALYAAGFHLANNADFMGLARTGGGDDPTDRILRVLEIVRELKSEKYPRCEWTEKGDSLFIQLHAYKSTYSIENVEKLLGVYASFVVDNWKLDPQFNPASYGFGYFVTVRMAELYKIKGDQLGGVDRFLDVLEGKVKNRFEVEYLRAMYYLNEANSPQQAAKKAELLGKARQLLNGIYVQADGLYKRKALATLAARAFYDRDWVSARETFSQYVKQFPDSPYAWVAAFRIGQCSEEAGDWRAAVVAYQAVRATGDWAPFASVVTDVFAGRAHEATGESDKALVRFRHAADTWDPSFGESFGMSLPLAPLPNEPIDRMPVLPERVDRLSIEARAIELGRSLAEPGGQLIEQARWLLNMKRWGEAARTADQAASEFPKSANTPEARYLSHRAQLEEALERANVEKPEADAKAAMAILDRLSAEPFDFAVGIADIARAYIGSGGGASPQGEKLLLDALAKLKSTQPRVRELSALEKDVADIRSQIFRPNGDAIFAGSRWNGFSWPRQPAPFVLTAPEVRVKLANGQTTRLSFVQRFAHLDNAVFVDERQLELLNSLITRLGGSKTREGQIFFDKGLMETPSVPIGPSLNVMAFLNKGFRVMAGHWGGWIFTTFPAIGEIVFIDEARTRALVRVIVGYAGGDVMLEKKDGVWVATTLNQTWVT